MNIFILIGLVSLALAILIELYHNYIVRQVNRRPINNTSLEQFALLIAVTVIGVGYPIGIMIVT